jgi:hypothetical protein
MKSEEEIMGMLGTKLEGASKNVDSQAAPLTVNYAIPPPPAFDAR